MFDFRISFIALAGGGVEFMSECLVLIEMRSTELPFRVEAKIQDKLISCLR
jgi:hypothetical protein